ncbi:MAG: AraC family transcriptional regulator [Chitinophagaceae bacterium]
MHITLTSVTEGLLSFSDYLNPLLPVKRIPGADINVAKGNFGCLVFQRLEEKRYAVALNDFFIEQPHEFTYRSHSPLLMVFINLSLNQQYEANDFGRLIFYERGLNLLYQPETYVRMSFRKPGHYSCFMLHLSEKHIEPFAAAYEPLNNFLEKIQRQEPAMLWPRNGIASHDMLKLVNDFIHPIYTWPTRELYEENKIKETLATSTLCAPDLSKNVYHIPEEDVEMVYRIKTQLLKRLDKPFSMPELADSFSLTEYKTNALFKRIYGVTVPEFLKDARMDAAQKLLIENEKNESQIALLVGYSSIQSFSLAYKNHFGYLPHLEKRYYGD